MPLRQLLFLGFRDYQSGAHDALLPLWESQAELEKQGIQLIKKEVDSVEAFAKAVEDFNGAAVLGCFPWAEEKTSAVAAWSAVRRKTGQRLAHFDPFDPVNSRQWACLPLVDVYFKSHQLACFSEYMAPSPSGCPFPDFLNAKLKIDLKGWHYRSPFDRAHENKIKSGWHYSAMKRYRTLSRLGRFAPPYRYRPIDINLRFAVHGKYPDTWYDHYRQFANEQLRSVQGARFSKTNRVRFRRYAAELWFTKIVFSPFGWGEVCYRDFEALSAGALLIKPQMDHVRTTPAIFEAEVTYVPVRWDLSDLREKCRYYLAHGEEAAKIAKAGQTRYAAFFEENAVVRSVKELVA